jgi:hypothetical protein
MYASRESKQIDYMVRHCGSAPENSLKVLASRIRDSVINQWAIRCFPCYEPVSWLVSQCMCGEGVIRQLSSWECLTTPLYLI